MPLLQVTESTGDGDVDELLPTSIPVHVVGHQRVDGRIAGPQVEVEPAVVVEVAEVGPHRGAREGQAELPGCVVEATLAVVPIDPDRDAALGEPQVAAGDIRNRWFVAGDQQIDVAVVVVVPEPARKALLWSGHAELRCDIPERAVSLVVVEAVQERVVRDEEIGPAVSVVVSPDRRLGVQVVLDSSLTGDIGEGTVAIIPKELGVIRLPRPQLVADEEIEIAIVVIVRPGGGLGREVIESQPGCAGDVAKRTVLRRSGRACSGDARQRGTRRHEARVHRRCRRYRSPPGCSSARRRSREDRPSSVRSVK